MDVARNGVLDGRVLAGVAGLAEAEQRGRVGVALHRDRELIFVVVDADTAAEHDLVAEVVGVPGDAKLRTEVGLLHAVQIAALAHGQAGEECRSCAGSDDAEIVLLVVERSKVIPAQTEVEGQRRGDLEVVLNERAEDVHALVLAVEPRDAGDRIEVGGFGERRVVQEVPEAVEGVRRTRIADDFLQELDVGKRRAGLDVVAACNLGEDVLIRVCPLVEDARVGRAEVLG